MIRRSPILLALLAPLLLATPALAETRPADGPLHHAVARGDLLTIEHLLSEGTPIDTPGTFGDSPLQHVIDGGNRLTKTSLLAVVDFLIEHGADVDFKNDYGSTPLHKAAPTNLSVARRLIAAGADVNAVDSAGASPLYVTLETRRSQEEFAELLALMVAAGLDVNLSAREDETLLHRAVRVRQSAVDDLIAVGAQVNVSNAGGQTPLQIACGLSPQKHPDLPEAVTALLEAGAEVNIKNNYGTTPLHTAALKGVPIAKLLVAAGADVNGVDSAGASPLYHTLESPLTAEEFKELLELMVTAGLEINKVGPGEETLLHRAAYVRPGAVDDLIAAGAQVNMPNAQGKTPLHLASALYARNRPAMPEAVTALLEAGADIDARDDRNNTPLVVASPDATPLLLGWGASAAGSAAGKPPLHDAASHADIDRVRQLLAAGADPRARWGGRRAIDRAFDGLRKNYTTYARAQKRGGSQYFAVIDQLVAAGGGEWIDKCAAVLGLHPARLRYFRFHAIAFSVVYSPPITLGLLAAVFGLLPSLKRRRWGKAIAQGALVSFLGTALLFGIATLWLAQGNEEMAILIPFFLVGGWLAAAILLAVCSSIAYSRSGRKRPPAAGA